MNLLMLTSVASVFTSVQQQNTYDGIIVHLHCVDCDLYTLESDMGHKGIVWPDKKKQSKKQKKSSKSELSTKVS